MATTEPSLSVSTTETSPILRTLEVEVDAKEVRKAFDKAYRELGRSVRVRGFRPGKAPRTVLEKLYGASLAEEIEKQLVSDTLAAAVDQSGIEPVAEPDVDATPPIPGEAFRYRVAVEVKPAIELPGLVGLAAKRPRVEVTEEDVREELEGLRQRRATWVEEQAGTVAASGHQLRIDYVGKVDGVGFEGGSAEGALLELGSGRFLPGFEDQLLGVQAGESRDLAVRFPEDYAADLAGKDAVFSVTVHAVLRREMPSLDDAFAQALGDGLETLAALEERVRSDLEKAREAESKREARRTLMDDLIGKTGFEVPPGMVENHLRRRLQMAHRQLENAMPHEALHRQLSEWREQWRPDAEREVRETLLLEAVARQQGIEASAEEIDARLAEMAREQGLDPSRLRQAYEEGDALRALGSQICEEKALEFLLAEAKVEETTGT